MKKIFLSIILLFLSFNITYAQFSYKVGVIDVALTPTLEDRIFVQAKNNLRCNIISEYSREKEYLLIDGIHLNPNQFIISSEYIKFCCDDYISQIYKTDYDSVVIVLPEIRLSLKKDININSLLEKHPQLSITKKRPNTYHLACEVNTSDEVLYLISQIEKENIVKWSEPTMMTKLHLYNTLYSQQFYLGSCQSDTVGINAIGAWNYTKGSSNIVVAIVDDGVELTHPDLQNNLLQGYTINDNNGYGAPTYPVDVNPSHGTSIAGLVGAVDNSIGIIGVASGCKILPVAIHSFAELAEAIEYASQYADVINCSLGGNALSDVIQAIDNAVAYGRNGKGCIVVAASGNNSQSYVSFPAYLNNVIGVGAVDRQGYRWVRSQYGEGLDLMAPGAGNIMTTVLTSEGSYKNILAGTSLSAPQVAGVAALMLSMRPDLTAAQVKEIICNTARSSGTGWNSEYGYGLVDAGAAMNAIRLNLSISGPSVFCYEETYTLNGIPSALTDSCVITWSVVNAGNGYNAIPSLTPDSIYCTVSHDNPQLPLGYGLDVYLKATVTYNGIVLGTAQKEIIMHENVPTINGSQSSNLYNNLSYGEKTALEYWQQQVPGNNNEIEGYLINPTCSVTVASQSFHGMTLDYSGATPSYWQVMGRNNDSICFVLPYSSSVYAFNITTSNPDGSNCGNRTIPFRVDPIPLTAGSDIFGAELSGYDLEVGFGVNMLLGDDTIVPEVDRWHLYRTKVGYGMVFDLGVVYGNSTTLSTAGLTSGYYVFTGIWNNHTYSATVLIP